MRLRENSCIVGCDGLLKISHSNVHAHWQQKCQTFLTAQGFAVDCVCIQKRNQFEEWSHLPVRQYSKNSFSRVSLIIVHRFLFQITGSCSLKYCRSSPALSYSVNLTNCEKKSKAWLREGCSQRKIAIETKVNLLPCQTFHRQKGICFPFGTHGGMAFIRKLAGQGYSCTGLPASFLQPNGVKQSMRAQLSHSTMRWGTHDE